MNISLCTITFRHHLVSLEQIADWASRNGFQGIEIWGAHARHIPFATGHDARWLAGFGLQVPMVSDYLPLHKPEALEDKTVAALNQARRWDTTNIRTFVGPSGSADMAEPDRKNITSALRAACEQVAEHGRSLLVETHPGTLADTLASTVRLLDEVDHPALGINFDALHVWEGGDDPCAARQVLQPKIRNYHFKNISARSALPVFAPNNIYDAAGSRDGIVPVFEGEMDYTPLLQDLAEEPDARISLEWFGDNVFDTLKRDCAALHKMLGDAKTSLQHAS
ncbi:sugar phosphate isomerase/epimerase family protein [Tateyamaria sp. ANG-S1]|uniref:sugar phosphate isomerase/epimerase family protein n=1 Tax=Tateyamaria sp. ANG-S1 TaxID=1577905 RepID=UPI00057CBD16|nr:sugar phosphate isomerase/epimerase family protein [Tateyamaria sp. ANG-S1]KIC47852.1 3-dehydroshikimate dehydratase [Tateyamaria sp. ANG-S1]